MNKPEDEIKVFNEKLYGDKMVDLQLLGVGVSGHIGFNEPGRNLLPEYILKNLMRAPLRLNSRFFVSPDDVPRESITMGIGDIMKAEKLS